MNRITKKYRSSLLEELQKELREEHIYTVQYGEADSMEDELRNDIAAVESMNTMKEIVEFEVERFDEEPEIFESILDRIIKLIDGEEVEEIPEWERKSLKELNSL